MTIIMGGWNGQVRRDKYDERAWIENGNFGGENIKTENGNRKLKFYMEDNLRLEVFIIRQKIHHHCWSRTKNFKMYNCLIYVYIQGGQDVKF